MALTGWVTDTANDVLREEFPDDYAAGTRARTEALTAARAAVEHEREVSGVRADIPANLGAVWGELSNAERRTWLHAWFTVIAVGKAARRADVMGKRVTMWNINDTDAPDGFIVRDIGADGRGRRIAVRRPIPMR